MTPERFRQIEELYHAAREGTPEERAAFLAEADPAGWKLGVGGSIQTARTELS